MAQHNITLQHKADTLRFKAMGHATAHREEDRSMSVMGEVTGEEKEMRISSMGNMMYFSDSRKSINSYDGTWGNISLFLTRG